jgi:hypothetical protein
MDSPTTPTTRPAAARPGSLDPDPTSATVDVDALLAGVYRRHRRHQRRRLVGSGVGVVAAGVLAAVALTAGGGSGAGNDGSGSSSGTGQTVALTPYAVSVTRDATPVAVVDGLELTYLPAGLPAQPSVETGTSEPPDAPAETYTQACFGDPACASDSLGVSVTRSPELDLARYVEIHSVGDAPTETTVGGQSALAIGVESDEASGLVWSPQPGVVIEVNVDSDMAAELRQVVDGARFTG